MTTRARSSFALTRLPGCTRRPPVRPEIGAVIVQYATFRRAVSTAASSRLHGGPQRVRVRRRLRELLLRDVVLLDELGVALQVLVRLARARAVALEVRLGLRERRLVGPRGRSRRGGRLAFTSWPSRNADPRDLAADARPHGHGRERRRRGRRRVASSGTSIFSTVGGRDGNGRRRRRPSCPSTRARARREARSRRETARDRMRSWSFLPCGAGAGPRVDACRCRARAGPRRGGSPRGFSRPARARSRGRSRR